MKTRIALFLLIAAPALAGAPNVLIVLPFENLSGERAASTNLLPVMQRSIEKKGWELISAGRIETLLETDRIRSLDSIDATMRHKLAAEWNATAFLLTTIYTYSESDNPVVAVSARLIRPDGTAVWGEMIGLTAEDTAHILGVGRAQTAADLGHDAVVRLLARFPTPGLAVRLTREPEETLSRGRPRSSVASELSLAKTPRVAVLPFDAVPGARQATRLVHDSLTIRLEENGAFDVIEPGDLRAAMRALQMPSLRGVTSTELAALGRELGTDLFIRGSIYTFREAEQRGSAPPELQFEMSMVNVASSRVLWSCYHGRQGSDYQGFLMLGRVSNGVSLTDRLIREAIAEQRNGRLRRSSRTAER